MRELEQDLSCDFGLDEAVTLEVAAEIVGAPPSLVARLARAGLIDARGADGCVLLVPLRSVVRLRRIGRLRRDLGVNFAGAAVILDLVMKLETMRRELEQLRGVQEPRGWYHDWIGEE